MIASVSGSPSVPARTTDCGVPPTATQTGSGSCSGRGHTPASSSGARWRPDHVTRLGVADREQQLELLGEQLVVVVEVVAEQRERLGERAAAGHDLGASAREQVDLGELLEDPHRIVGAEHGDRAREPDPLGPHRDRGQHDGRRRDEEVGAVVLADREHVEPQLVGELGLLHQVAHPLLGGDARREVGEGGESKFHVREGSR